MYGQYPCYHQEKEMRSITSFRIISALILLLIVAGCTASGIKNTDSNLRSAGENHDMKTVPSPIPKTASEEGIFTTVGGKEVRVLPEYSKNRLIVRYKTDGNAPGRDLSPTIDAMNRKMGATVLMDFATMGVPGMQIIRTPNLSVEEAVQSLSNNTEILYAEPDHLIALSPGENVSVNASADTGDEPGPGGRNPDDPDYPLLWGLHNTGQSPFTGTPGSDIDAPDAWGITTGSSSVVIAVIDTGVDYTHPDLAANIWTNPGEIADNRKDDDGNGYTDDIRGWNFVSDDNDPDDDYGHGTHCAGIIAAVGDNNLGVTGICWKACIMPLKFLDSSGNGYTSDAISAILYANQAGADVISLSWGGTVYSRALKEAIDESSAVVACAAGNDGADSDRSPVYPAAYTSSQIISVAATDCNDKLASFSNYGATSVDIAAPGVQIRSTWPDYQYRYLSGTSMATPHVSGVAALLKASDSTLTATTIREKITGSADEIPALHGKAVSGGRLNAAVALGGTRESGTGLTERATGGSGETGLHASFIAAPTKGTAPLRVQFLDTSSGGPAAWLWSFGDGEQSGSKSPRHIYEKKGKYTVTLKATRENGVNIVSQIGYITAT